ncbi:protein of unknown function [Taphrina deformans PYCC 5710]|uniref:DlpA domain protein n=1 Tax=Taphrina deformans (strain PYCC 5710 / ATCC 11124 / CBS 356.35 / IMI 108563 / JCM 9778 / NBRC 8474) TaxID=1097556 RepID=R4XLW6_TAPDE|nr:protein of unknown function [Taphrina deformans PYCC 5710]|eukprot:CCG84285.1 protein of unknown function [Taphrina deformans PYCC 5710]
MKLPVVSTALRRFSTCDVSDALLKLGVKNGGFLPDIIQRTSPKADTELPIVGKAWTVRFVEKSSSETADFKGHYIDRVPEHIESRVVRDEVWPVIPILGAPERLTCAVLGGIMALRASLLKAKAIVVSGRIRDVQEMNAPDSTAPVFASGTSSVGAGAGSKVTSIGSSCEVAHFGTVYTGDTVMIDENGIVIIPLATDLEKLVEIMEKLTAQDEQVKDSVRAGMTVESAFKKWRT